MVKNIALQVSYPGKYVLSSGQRYSSYKKGIFFICKQLTYIWFIIFPPPVVQFYVLGLRCITYIISFNLHNRSIKQILLSPFTGEETEAL